MGSKAVYLRLAVLFGLIAYFAGHALTGEHGLLTAAERRRTLTERTAELDELRAERRELEARIRGLSPEHLSVDLVEERARHVLGYARPDDYVIRTSGAAGA